MGPNNYTYCDDRLFVVIIMQLQETKESSFVPTLFWRFKSDRILRQSRLKFHAPLQGTKYDY